MKVCCCSLAGTDACKYCGNGAAEKTSIWTNASGEDYTNCKKVEDAWEIPSFMLKGDSNDS